MVKEKTSLPVSSRKTMKETYASILSLWKSALFPKIHLFSDRFSINVI